MTYNQSYSAFQKRFVRNLREVIKDKNLSQTKLEELGLDSRYIRRLKSGEYNTSLKTLWKIGAAIGVDPEVFIMKNK